MLSRSTLKSLAIPGGALLLGVAILVYSGWLTLALPALSFLYYSAILGGMLLAWRFHSSRSFLALLVLFLAQQAIALSGGGHISPGSSAWIVFTITTVLVPLNFILVAVMPESGFTIPALAPLGLLLFLETIVVTVLSQGLGKEHAISHLHHAATAVAPPGYAIITFSIAGGVLLVRALITGKPLDSALLWSLLSFFLSIRFLEVPRTSTTYMATAGCILAAAIIETSYLLAYHDELTGLPGRRAFNAALLRLQAPYSIAAVDIDHFKKFNDTYGHDTGDQVLRLVAGRLARVTGGGQAYRCGGEEFSILFPGKTTAEVKDHLERLRLAVENAEFHQRGSDRRQVPRGPDRRESNAGKRVRGRPRKGDAIRRLAQPESPIDSLSVTVSIGVASSSAERSNPDLVMQAADKALYRAKANGRNRLETASSARRRDPSKQAAGIA